ncbi:MAG: UDP-3-O-acyl-N-acetylglucosamine deacetylase [Proteobacteria bacterium]|nr:UDP-3-O-acyl-N-acetylglucosamine deacetylase [Pseudomonadota bacterium]
MGKVTRLADSFWQRSLRNSARCTGISLHGGVAVSLAIHPAAPDSGILFRRTDVPSDVGDIPAHCDYIGATELCTTLVNEHGIRVATVEHLMAALAGCEIDNAVIELNGPEIPIMDGSAEPFVTLIEQAGIVEQDFPRRMIRVLRPVTVREGDSVASLEPYDGFSITLDIDFNSGAIGRQGLSLDVSCSAFKTDICRARTFGFLHEVQAMVKAGFARGGSLDNAVVVDGDKVVNEGGLRYTDEFVRHKVLDCIGDMYLAGGPLLGKFRGVKSGHAMHHKLLRALFDQESAWTTVSGDRPAGMSAPTWDARAVAASA